MYIFMSTLRYMWECVLGSHHLWDSNILHHKKYRFYKARTLNEGLVQWLSACWIPMMTWVVTPSTQVKKVQWCTCNPRAGRAEIDGPLELIGQPPSQINNLQVQWETLPQKVIQRTTQKDIQNWHLVSIHVYIYTHTTSTKRVHMCAHAYKHTEYLINPWNS